MELTFRDKKMKKETKQRIVLLVVVFFAALVFFNFVLNFKESESVTVLGAPTLPVVTVERDGVCEARLFGYVNDMDACYMRDTVVAIGKDRRVPLTVYTYGQDIEEMAYEIRSTDTTRKIAETVIEDYTKSEDVITAEPVMENLIEAGEEYLLVIKLSVEDRSIRYYTRIMMTEGDYAAECIDFALKFSKKARAHKTEAIDTYLEPDSEHVDDVLSHVTIHSPLELCSWLGFDGELLEEPTAQLKDIGTDYCALELDYIVKAGEDRVHNYKVREYFKLRHGAERIYMLDYDRTMEEILHEDGIYISDNIIEIGAHPGSLSYFSNETGSIVAFTQAGALYEYNQNTASMICVYDFRPAEISDWRINNNDHDIRILSIDESGTMDFAVLGYMNCGSHEGECGIDLYHYDAATGRAREKIFISSSDSYQILSARFSSNLYMSTKNIFYVMVDGTLLEVDLGTMTNREVVTSLEDGMYASSKSGRYFAYITEPDVADKIHVMDLEESTSYEISAKEGQKLCPVDFLDEDFVYGMVKDGDEYSASGGSTVYPMYQLVIRQSATKDGKTLKKYKKPGYYVVDSQKDGTTLTLHRMIKKDGSYKPTADDTIRNSSGETNKEVEVVPFEDELTGCGLSIVMTDIKSKKQKATSSYRASLVLLDVDQSITASAAESQDRFFSYMGSRVIYAGSSLKKAITEADAQMGIVLDGRAHYIWKRGRGNIKSPITGLAPNSADAGASSDARSLSAMIAYAGESMPVGERLSSGKTPVEILEEALGERMILDLTGCTLTQTLYYVSRSTPVYARTGDGSAVLIVGYDALNVTVYDPNTGKNTRMGLKDATKRFEEAGNIFVTYLDIN